MAMHFDSSTTGRPCYATRYGAASNDNGEAMLVGFAATIIVFLGALVLGFQVDASTRFLLSSVAPTIRFLASVDLVTGAVILVLMFSLLSARVAQGKRIDAPTGRRVRLLSIFSGAMVAASLALLLVPGPVSFDALPKVVYYAIVAHSAVLGGLLIATVILGYLTLTRLMSASDTAARVSHFSGDDEEHGKYSGL